MVQPAGRGGPTSPYFVNTDRGGRYFSIHKNAELAGFCTYALSHGCLEGGVPRLCACAHSCSGLRQLALKLGENLPVRQLMPEVKVQISRHLKQCRCTKATCSVVAAIYLC